MISYDQAKLKVLANTAILPAENIQIEDSIGRTLVEDVYSGIEMPPFDKSAVDGYALNSQDLKSASAGLKCIGLIQAGEFFKKALSKGECVKIMTGATLPKNADCVIMVEDTQADGARIKLLKAVKIKENVCIRAEDLKKGQKVINRGQRISISHLPLLATIGRNYVKVTRKPKVAVLNTGGEIVDVGRRLPKNKIYNSNGPLLCSILKGDGITPINLGIAKDNLRELRPAVKKGLEVDVLLISGGVSMGDYDLVPQVLTSLGVREIFHKVNIKPGKPLFFGRRAKTIIFGIPGNPVSNFLTYLIFVRPALLKMMGYSNYEPVLEEGICGQDLRSKGGRRHFVLAKISEGKALPYLSPVRSHGSADILALSKADGFLIMEENAGIIKKGDKIKFLTW